jgi:hypothetical protein
MVMDINYFRILLKFLARTQIILFTIRIALTGQAGTDQEGG